MPAGQSQAEQLAREIAREASFLPERFRLWLFEQLRQDSAAVDGEQHKTNQLNQKMAAAVEALERVARHLKLEDKKAQLALTMREFNAAPEPVREGWKARQIAELMRGEWGLAKAVAFTDTGLPVEAERDYQRKRGLSRKRREGAFVLSGIQAWLESSPNDKSRANYDKWARAQNKQLAEGQKNYLGAENIQRRWPFPWPEIVEAVEQQRLPGEAEQGAENEELEAGETEQTRTNAPLRAVRICETPEANINLNLRLDTSKLRSARKAKGLNLKQLSELAQVEASNLKKIERGEIRNPAIKTVAKLAAVLGLSLDSLIVNDE